MTNLKRVFLVMVIAILLGTTIAFASDTIVITGEEENTTTNTATNTSTTIGGGNTANTNTSTYNATNTNGNLPQTGEYDHIYALVIGAFAISAIYAYKKITDYKNI